MIEKKDNLNKEEKTEDLDSSASVGRVEKSILGMVGIFFLELVKVAVLAGVTIFLVRYFLFKPFYVKGQSMEPTFYEKEYLIIDEISHRFREPKRGEVVVFRSPVGQNDFYLKRIVGLPGERVKIEGNKVIIYNSEHLQGVVVDESYIDEKTAGSVTVTLGPEEYYVLGDNRDSSFDSRRFGAINRDAFIGRAWLRGWPFDRITTFDTPEYNL